MLGPEIYFDFSLPVQVVTHSLDDFPNKCVVLEIIREENTQLPHP